MEDYVSFETANLLKEKGFDERGLCVYTIEDQSFHVFGDWVENSCLMGHLISAPTLQMAMKWLRTKNIFIDIFHYNSKMAPFVWLIFAYDVLAPQRAETYEEAVENAIKYVLEHWDDVNDALSKYYENDSKYLKI